MSSEQKERLSPEQEEIIKAQKKRILVKAGAGTGKTRVMIERVLALLEQDPNLNINDFAIITFTNKATEEIQNRIKISLYRKWRETTDLNKKQRFRLQLDLLNQSNISTIHKFCHTILNTMGPFYNDKVAYSPNYSIGSSDLRRLFDYSIERWIKDKRKLEQKIHNLDFKYIYELRKFIINIFEEIRNKGLDFEEIKQSTRISTFTESTIVRVLKNEIIEILDLMFKYKKNYKYNKLDTNDLLEYTSFILENNNELKQNVKKKYKHIFVDEFQDTSLFQSKIIKLLCDGQENSPSLFVVGDVKQSIYQFRGADLSAYRDMEKWIEQDEKGSIMKLNTNWRSTPELVWFVNDVFKKIKENSKYNFFHEELIPRESKEKIRLSDAYTWIKPSKENRHEKDVARFLSEQNPTDLKNFAILTRYNYQIPKIINALKQYNLTPSLDESGYFYNQIEILDIFKVLKSFIQSNNTVLKEEAINSLIFKSDKLLYESIYNDILKNQLIYYYTPTQILNYIYLKVDIFKNLNTQQIANLKKLKEKSREIFRDEHITFKEYVEWLKMMIVSNQEEELADVPKKNNNSKVQVMTIHKAKGLEFPYVILPYLDSKFVKQSLNPEFIINQDDLSLEFSYKKRESETKIISSSYDDALKNIQMDLFSEELRVLYVALTRAEKKLYFIGDPEKKTPHESFLNWLIGE